MDFSEFVLNIYIMIFSLFQFNVEFMIDLKFHRSFVLLIEEISNMNQMHLIFSYNYVEGDTRSEIDRYCVLICFSLQ